MDASKQTIFSEKRDEFFYYFTVFIILLYKNATCVIFVCATSVN